MARDLELALKVSADSSGAAKEIDRLGRNLLDLGRQAGLSDEELGKLADEIDRIARDQALIDTFRRQKKALIEAKQAMQAAKQKAQQLGRELAQTENPSKRLRNEFERARQEAKRSAESYQRQQVQLQRLRDAMRQAGISTTNLAAHQRQLNQQTRQLVTDFLRLKKASHGSLDPKAFRKARREIEKTERSVAGVVDRMGRLCAAISAVAAGSGLGAVVGQALEMEEAMTRVAKTTGLAGDDLDRLKRQIQDMAEATGTASEELARMAAVGGQLGVSADQIGEFVRLANEMGVAFDISADQAATAIGTLTNAMGLSLDEVRALGDAVNVLGNNMAAREGDIVNVVTRVAGMAKTFGLAKEEIAALAAAFLSLGKPPEVAATAINALLNKLQTAPAQGKGFREALDQIGLSADQLSRNIRQNAMGAITDLLQRLKALPPQMRAIALTRLFGQEFQDDIGGVVASLDVLNKSLGLVRENTEGALSEEFNRQLQTAQKSIDRLREAAKNLAEAIGSQLLDDVASAAGSLTDLTQSVREFVQANPQVVEIAKNLAEMLVVVKGLSLAGRGLKGLGSDLGAVGAGARELGASGRAAQLGIAGLTAALTDLRVALAGFAGFKLGEALTQDFGAASERVKAFGASVALELEQIKVTAEAVFQAAATQSLQPLEALPARLEQVRQAFTDIGNAFAANAEAIDLAQAFGLDAVIARLNEGKLSVEAFNAAMREVRPNADQLVAALSNVNAATPKAAFDALVAAIGQLQASSPQAAQALKVVTQNFIDGRINASQYAQAIGSINASAGQFSQALRQITAAAQRQGGASLAMVKAMDALNQAMSRGAGAARKFARGADAAAQGLRREADSAKTAETAMGALARTTSEAAQASGQYSSAAGQLDAQLADLARQYNQGAISAQEFESRSRELTAAFEGTASAATQAAGSVDELNRAKQSAPAASSEAASAEQEFIKSLESGISIAERYAQALERLRQAKEDAARAPPVRPDRGGAGGLGSGGGRTDEAPLEAETRTVVSPFPQVVQRYLREHPDRAQAIRSAYQSVLNAVNRFSLAGTPLDQYSIERRIEQALAQAVGGGNGYALDTGPAIASALGGHGAAPPGGVGVRFRYGDTQSYLNADRIVSSFMNRTAYTI